MFFIGNYTEEYYENLQESVDVFRRLHSRNSARMEFEKKEARLLTARPGVLPDLFASNLAVGRRVRRKWWRPVPWKYMIHHGGVYGLDILVIAVPVFDIICDAVFLDTGLMDKWQSLYASRVLIYVCYTIAKLICLKVSMRRRDYAISPRFWYSLLFLVLSPVFVFGGLCRDVYLRFIPAAYAEHP